MFAAKSQKQKDFSAFLANAAQSQAQKFRASVRCLCEGAGRLMFGDDFGHIGQAATALHLAARRAMHGSRRRDGTRRHQFIDGAVVQGIADADEQGVLPDNPIWIGKRRMPECRLTCNCE